MTEQRRLGDRYELGEVIGRGGMAEVHEGHDLRLGRRVAVKILRPDLARDPAFQARFRREAQSAASLNHPNIVAVYDTGEDVLADGPDGGTGTIVPYIVMEYVDGMTLRQLTSSGRRLLPERAMEIADGVLAALDYSHRHGIVHRDIKPGNVMLTRAGEVKVMDFGIARALADAGQTMTATSTVMGTAQYLSPEQARGEMVDSRSDIYSTGCLLYELLTGRPPFTGDSPVAVAYQHVSESPVPPSQLDPSIPPTIDAIVLKALAKRPADRYQSAADMRSDVERAIAGLPVTAAHTPVTATAPAATTAMPAVGPPSAPPREGRSPWLWVAVVVGVAAVGVAMFLVGRTIFGTPAVDTVAVPPLAGLSIDEAQAKLAESRLVLGQQTPMASDDRVEGTIISQNPTAGQQVPVGQAVDVTFSTGKAQVAVPNLVDLSSPDDARDLLRQNNLLLGKVKEQNSDQPAGTVLSQDPPEGTMVDVGSQVSIKVSDGKVKVPDVVNKSEAEARAMLTSAGVPNPQVITQETDQQPPGTVLAQSPSANTPAPKGTQVTITVAVALPPPPPPTSPPPPAWNP